MLKTSINSNITHFTQNAGTALIQCPKNQVKETNLGAWKMALKKIIEG